MSLQITGDLTPIHHYNIGDLVYHYAFGACTVQGRDTENCANIIVDLEADFVEYYRIGYGYKKIERDLSTRKNLFTDREAHFFKSKEDVPKRFSIAIEALSPSIGFWGK